MSPLVSFMTCLLWTYVQCLSSQSALSWRFSEDFFLFCFYYIYFQLKGNVAEAYKTLSLIMIVIVIVEWDHGWLLIGEQ